MDSHFVKLFFEFDLKSLPWARKTHKTFARRNNSSVVISERNEARNEKNDRIGARGASHGGDVYGLHGQAGALSLAQGYADGQGHVVPGLDA